MAVYILDTNRITRLVISLLPFIYSATYVLKYIIQNKALNWPYLLKTTIKTTQLKLTKADAREKLSKTKVRKELPTELLQ